MPVLLPDSNVLEPISITNFHNSDIYLYKWNKDMFHYIKKFKSKLNKGYKDVSLINLRRIWLG